VPNSVAKLSQNLQKPAAERLGLRQAVGGRQQSREESGSESWMVRAVSLLIDRECSPHQRFGLPQAIGGLQQLREIVKRYGDLWMLWPVALPIDAECSAKQGLSLPQSAHVLQ